MSWLTDSDLLCVWPSVLHNSRAMQLGECVTRRLDVAETHCVHAEVQRFPQVIKSLSSQSSPSSGFHFPLKTLAWPRNFNALQPSGAGLERKFNAPQPSGARLARMFNALQSQLWIAFFSAAMCHTLRSFGSLLSLPSQPPSV